MAGDYGYFALFAVDSGGDFDRGRERFAATTASLSAPLAGMVCGAPREKPGGRLLVSVVVVGESI